MGRPFPSPFAKPPGEGLSSSTVNVLSGALNVAVAHVLLCQVGAFDLRNVSHLGIVGIAREVPTLAFWIPNRLPLPSTVSTALQTRSPLFHDRDTSRLVDVSVKKQERIGRAA